MEILKPCPFCGADPELTMGRDLRYNAGHAFGLVWTIRCPVCFTKKEAVSIYRVDISEKLIVEENARAKLVEAWNRRVLKI